MTEMIALKALTKRFGPLVAVDGISLTVAAGEVLCFLGPNGAGKSTTMRMITGFIEPTAGTVEVAGLDVTRHPVEIKRRIGYLPEGAPSYGDMTPGSYLGFIAEIRGFDGAEKHRRIDAVVEKVELASVLHQPIETLSKGFKRRVGLAQAMLHDPAVLIMDEPTDGLDPNQKQQVRSLIREMSKRKAIVISTHILEEVEAVCTRAIIIAHGRLLADGTPDELLARAPNHNAVIMTVDAPKAGEVIRELEKLDAIASVEKASEADGLARLRVLPKNRVSIAADIGRLVRAKDLPVSEMFVEKGTLDDVFRHITTGGGKEDGVAYIRIIAKREIMSYFATPLAFIFIVIFLALTGAFAFYVGGFFTREQADLRPFFIYHPWIYLMLIPAIAMRLWAEERKTGTIELLMTLPISTTKAVLGKFFAAWIFIVIALALTFPFWITVNFLGDPDNGVILASYIGSIIMAGAFLAIGSCISALTKNQVIAFIIAAAACFLFLMSGLELVQAAFTGWNAANSSCTH